MNISAQDIQHFSRISSRGVYGRALTDIAQDCPCLKVLVADVMKASRLADFSQKYPDKFLNVGIAEQNMIGIAAGLASEGSTVFTSSFGPFASMRCFEMLRTQLGYMNLNVKVVGLMSGLASETSGNTHYGLEDLAITRSIPNMTVLSPADGLETYKAVVAAAEHQGPVYIRLTGINGFPAVYKEDYAFEIGKGIQVREGEHVAIIATGTMVHEALRAARALSKENISAAVFDMHTIKPLDTELLDNIFSRYRLVITAEEHFLAGGMGSAVAESQAGKRMRPPHLMLGIPDCFGKAGSFAYMLDQFGLTAPQIARRIAETYKELF